MTTTSAVFTGVNGMTYGFYSVARDGVGHEEAAPALADVTLTVSHTAMSTTTTTTTLSSTSSSSSSSTSSTTSSTTTAPRFPVGVGLDRPDLPWTVGGAKAWTAQSAVTHDGVDAAQSGAIGNGQESWMQTAVTGATSLGFWWRISSEAGDRLTFAIDGVTQMSTGGVQAWSWAGYDVPAGEHDLRWTYAKDATGSTGADAAWVDQFDVGLFGSAVALGSGWKWSPWFGYVNTTFAPWLYHHEHAWLYPFGDDPSFVVFWDATMERFWWTGSTLYPYLYDFTEGAWMWYLFDSTAPRWVVNLQTGQWEQW